MKFHNRLLRSHVLFLCAVFILAACSGLGGEPEIIATLPPATVAPETPSVSTTLQSQDIGFPQSPPDLANGAQIFAARCVECHGVNGEGDGALVLAGEVGDPGNFRDPSSARSQTPKQWFETITHGRIENLMPPWRDALTEQERWDVALYTYTMHYTPDQLALGEEIFARECVDCHGETGVGDGEEALANDLLVADLSDPARAVEIDDDALFVFIHEGASPDMPAFGEEGLSEEDIWSVIAYSRTLALTNTDLMTEPQTIAQVATPPADASETGAVRDVTGTVTNRTADGALPETMTVILRVYDATTFAEITTEARETTTDASADYGFVFEDVEVREDRLYLTAVEFNGRNFASGVFPGTPDADMVLPVDVYEITSDPADITITALVERVTVIGDALEIQRLMQFTNNSDRVFTETEQQPDGLYRSVQISLPPGSAILGFDNNAAYTVSEDGMTVYDMRPLIPNETRFTVVNYVVQYGGGAVIEYPLDYTVAGEVRVLVSPYDTMRAESELLPSVGEETLGDELYQGYGNRLALPAGTLLRYELSGEGFPAAAEDVQTTGDVVDADNLLLIVLGVIVVAALVLGMMFFFLNRRSDPQNAEINRLVNQITELNAQHDRGEINHDVYRRQQAELNRRLAELMESNSKDES